MSSVLGSASISGSIKAAVNPNLGNLSGNLFVADQSNITPGIGTGAGNSDEVTAVSGTVTIGTPVVINLTTLKDPVGNSLTTADIVGLKITNTSAPGSGTLSHGGGSEPVYGAAPLPITPGDFALQSFNAAGLPVTAGTAQNLQLTSSAGTVSYTVTALLRSA